jgi:hypothetical protein
MSDLRDLPDLASDVRERVVTPPYDAVSRRVRARRLRGAASTLASAVLVVGGVAVWQNAATTAGPPVPQPAEESPIPPTDESQWRAVVNGTDAHPFEIEGTDDGSIAVIWRALEHPEPTFALVIRDVDGRVHGMRIDSPVELTPVEGGWVGVRTTQGFFIGSDGTWTDLGQPGPSRRVRPGDYYINGQYGSWLYSSQRGTWSTMPMPYGNSFDGYVNPQGELVTCDGDGQGRVWITSGGRQSQSVVGATCDMTGRGDRVSAVGLGDEPDGSIPLMGLLVTTEDRLAVVRADFMVLSGVTSLTVTPAGSTLVTDASAGDAFVLNADRTQLVEPDRKLGLAFVAGDRLYATTYGFMKGPLLESDDDGNTWHEGVLPGMESSED